MKIKIVALHGNIKDLISYIEIVMFVEEYFELNP